MIDASIRCAIIGYGTAYSWGWMHARWIRAVPDLHLVAICDKDPVRAAMAKSDFPEVDACTDAREMTGRSDIDMVSVVTPHNTHASVVIDCLKAGKHVVVDKPMCLNVNEATEMIETAHKAERTLAVFHNRRHDGNIRAIKEAVDQGRIGEIFHIELSLCGYRRPGNDWRSRKEVSGGILYDWGSHAIDWVLHLIPSSVVQVSGFFHKLVWHEASIEDQAQAIILFENGVVADVMHSNIAFAGKPLWRILGTQGAITDTGKDPIKGYTEELEGPSGGSFIIVTGKGREKVKYRKSDWIAYYADMANHLKRDAPVPVSAEQGRRVIAVLEAAEKSAHSGRSEGIQYG